jgi:[ribosomal protein S5]-alanine N-acetyltransferase
VLDGDPRCFFGSPLPEIQLSNDRIEVRPFGPADLLLVEEASNDDFIPLITTVPKVYSDAEGRAFVERQQRRLVSGEGWSLAVVDREIHKSVGQIGLWISQIGKGRADIGYWIVRSARGRGLAAEALNVLSDWAFETIDVYRLSLFIEPWNTASTRTAERSGKVCFAVGNWSTACRKTCSLTFEHGSRQYRRCPWIMRDVGCATLW